MRRSLGGLAVGTAAWAAPAVLSVSASGAAGSPITPFVPRTRGRVLNENIPSATESRVRGAPGAAGSSPAASPATGGGSSSGPSVLGESVSAAPASGGVGAGQVGGASAGATGAGAAGAGATRGPGRAGPLAFTGFDPRRLVALGGGSLVTGAALLRAARDAADEVPEQAPS